MIGEKLESENQVKGNKKNRGVMMTSLNGAGNYTNLK